MALKIKSIKDVVDRELLAIWDRGDLSALKNCLSKDFGFPPSLQKTEDSIIISVEEDSITQVQDKLALNFEVERVCADTLQKEAIPQIAASPASMIVQTAPSHVGAM